MRMDVLTIGDALIDLFLSISQADEHSHQSTQQNELCFAIGSKIPVDDCQFFLGGNACNTAVGFSRLGLKTGIAAETGNDEFSQKIINGLQKDHIDSTFLKQTSGAQASFAIDIACMHDRVIFSRHVPRSHDIAIENAHCSWIYLTSLGDTWVSLYQRVFRYVQNQKIKLAFNPGSTQLKEGVDAFKDILAITDILFINKEEAEKIAYGTEQIAENMKKPEILLSTVQKLGPKIVSMTNGDKGSYCINHEGTVFFQEMIPSTFVQKTGVGDAYASGFLTAIFYGKDIQHAMIWGAMNSASVVEHMGAQTGLLTKEQLEEKINELKL